MSKKVPQVYLCSQERKEEECWTGIARELDDWWPRSEGRFVAERESVGARDTASDGRVEAGPRQGT